MRLSSLTAAKKPESVELGADASFEELINSIIDGDQNALKASLESFIPEASAEESEVVKMARLSIPEHLQALCDQHEID